MVQGSMCTKFQVCIVFRLVRRYRTNKLTDPYLQVKIGISSIGCSPHVRFDNDVISSHMSTLLKKSGYIFFSTVWNSRSYELLKNPPRQFWKFSKNKISMGNNFRKLPGLWWVFTRLKSETPLLILTVCYELY